MPTIKVIRNYLVSDKDYNILNGVSTIIYIINIIHNTIEY